jgi:hypothetical protein
MPFIFYLNIANKEMQRNGNLGLILKFFLRTKVLQSNYTNIEPEGRDLYVSLKINFFLYREWSILNPSAPLLPLFSLFYPLTSYFPLLFLFFEFPHFSSPFSNSLQIT